MQNTTTAPKVDTVLLSETVDGNYRVRRYRVERKGDADYSVLYRINVSTLAPKMGKNSEELEALNRFAQSLVQDTSSRSAASSSRAIRRPTVRARSTTAWLRPACRTSRTT